MALTRRALLAAIAAGMGGLPARALAGDAPRVATLDWALLETLLAMGVVPVAAAELVLFREVAVEPTVPASVIDLGLRGAPNFEALSLARPQLIFNSLYYAELEPKLSLIAPVETISVYSPGGQPFARARKAALRLGAATGAEAGADELIASVEAELGALKLRLAGQTDRQLLVVNLGDARHFRVFGPDSMFGEVLARLGFANAWRAGTSYAASAPIGLEALARFPEAFIIILRPVPPDARRVLPESALWNALPNVRERRVAVLESVNPFGGLPTARRFARLLAGALERARTGSGEGGGLG